MKLSLTLVIGGAMSLVAGFSFAAENPLPKRAVATATITTSPEAANTGASCIKANGAQAYDPKNQVCKAVDEDVIEGPVASDPWKVASEPAVQKQAITVER